MKITIKSSIKDKYYGKVSVENINDDINMDQLATMLFQACVAYGFSPKTVSEYINCELSESHE